jgi:hypothetical protein
VSTSFGDLFAYLEADIVHAQGSRPPSVPKAMDVIFRALELATDEWSEGEAGAELARLFARGELWAGQTRLLGALQRSPFVQVRGIRASRALWSALDQSA